MRVKDKEMRSKQILCNEEIDFSVLSVMVLQYFYEKLKRKTLKEKNNIDINLKKKINNLRFFEDKEKD